MNLCCCPEMPLRNVDAVEDPERAFAIRLLEHKLVSGTTIKCCFFTTQGPAEWAARSRLSHDADALFVAKKTFPFCVYLGKRL